MWQSWHNTRGEGSTLKYQPPPPTASQSLQARSTSDSSPSDSPEETSPRSALSSKPRSSKFFCCSSFARRVMYKSCSVNDSTLRQVQEDAPRNSFTAHTSRNLPIKEFKYGQSNGFMATEKRRGEKETSRPLENKRLQENGT